MLGSLPETCHTGQLWPIASIQKKRHILPVAMQFYAILRCHFLAPPQLGDEETPNTAGHRATVVLGYWVYFGGPDEKKVVAC